MSIISECRLCKSNSLIPVFSLGEMAFSGIFPETPEEKVPVGDLAISLCEDCGLGQLDRDFPAEEMYGDNYGYMSSLNASMVSHLGDVVQHLEKMAKLDSGDLVLDIGSNDGTMLSLYSSTELTLVGMDPTIVKYKSMYPSGSVPIPDFFTAATFQSKFGDKKAKLVTTVAMLYDLPDPSKFASDVRSVLADNGLWHIEVSYGPWMLETGAFDAVCHEHIEYYSLQTLKRLLDDAGMKIISLGFNDINGGSISVTATPVNNGDYDEVKNTIDDVLNQETSSHSNKERGWKLFDSLVRERLAELEEVLLGAKRDGKVVAGLGASTKGNVLLQALTPEALSAIKIIGEVNSFKFGRVTPGTNIPIVSESEILESKPDFILVLPWHFKSTFHARLGNFVAGGGKVIYPLPELSVIE